MKLFQLGNPGPLRDKLVRAVLEGKKIATSSLLSAWMLESEALPEIGEKQVLIDSHGKIAGTIKISNVARYRLADITESVAIAEGEGFTTVAEWRRAHEAFWKPQLVDDDTVVVVEWFKLV